MDKINCWITDSLHRIYSKDKPEADQYFQLNMAGNDRGSFQIGIRKESKGVQQAELKVETPASINLKVRRVGYVPVPHYNTQTDISELTGDLPGYVPDPLYESEKIELAYGETGAFWITVTTDTEVEPGTYSVSLQVQVEEELISELKCDIEISEITIEDRDNFPVTHWFYADALCDWYGVKPFQGEFWEIAENYITDLVTHGINVMHSPIFTPPTDGVKRPHQLLKIKEKEKGEYVFDWSDVKKWIKLAQSCGMKYFEWSHLFSQWGVKKAIRIYENYDGIYENSLLWTHDTAADSDIYYNFLSQFLPEFRKFLKKENILEESFFHLSDEPHGEEHLKNYKKARKILKEIAPWMKVMDALSEKEFAEKGLTDTPIASIKSSLEFVKADIPHWDYFCCGPRGPYLNRLLDTPLAKIRGTGWLLYKFNALGFLHWGYNYWYKSQTRKLIDPYFITDGKAWPNWAYGDTFVVYPGENKKPVDSIRWEIFAESLKDYALLQGVEVEEKENILKAFANYKYFPKNPAWYIKNRNSVLT